MSLFGRSILLNHMGSAESAVPSKSAGALRRTQSTNSIHSSGVPAIPPAVPAPSASPASPTSSQPAASAAATEEGINTHLPLLLPWSMLRPTAAVAASATPPARASISSPASKPPAPAIAAPTSKPPVPPRRNRSPSPPGPPSKSVPPAASQPKKFLVSAPTASKRTDPSDDPPRITKKRQRNPSDDDDDYEEPIDVADDDGPILLGSNPKNKFVFLLSFPLMFPKQNMHVGMEKNTFFSFVAALLDCDSDRFVPSF
jgi:hypothetical protein